MLNVGANKVEQVFLGSTEVLAIYLGDALVYSKAQDTTFPDGIWIDEKIWDDNDVWLY